MPYRSRVVKYLTTSTPGNGQFLLVGGVKYHLVAVPTLHLVHFRQQSRDKNNTVIKQNKVARQYNCASRISCFFLHVCVYLFVCVSAPWISWRFFFFKCFILPEWSHVWDLTSLQDRNLFVKMDKILVYPAINVQSFLSRCERYTVRTQLHTPSDMLLFEIMQINNWIAWWGLWIFFFLNGYIYISLSLSKTCHIIIIFFSIKLFLFNSNSLRSETLYF